MPSGPLQGDEPLTGFELADEQRWHQPLPTTAECVEWMDE